ncbi:MAG TPA: threonine synthase [Gaiellaceae bacterium]|nr:threonine synthase [Gaiellaceae bacterium]
MTTVASWLSLGEGSTPLVPARRLSESLGCELHLKCEGLNPTGSFKDRGMVVAVERAVQAGAKAVVCASTGNTAASAAAYAARAGVEAVVLTPAGATAGPKRAQVRAVGARVIEVRGSFDDALRLCRELGERDGYVVVNSVNPDRIEGQKSVVNELLEQLGGAPDIVALPFGGGGNVSAVAAGFAEAGAAPRIVVGQAAERTTTWASAIRIGDPAHAENVAELVAAGRIEVATLTEDQLRAAWERLAKDEGAFCEPASAAGLAALELCAASSLAGKVAVAILTGHGLKDTDAVAQTAETVVDATLDAVLEVLS